MNQYNKISVFASDARVATSESHATDIGYYYTDGIWENLADRKKGAREGIAYSINYNTAIRQATVMSSVLADILAERNTESNAYTYMPQNGIGATFEDSQENSMENHISNLAKIFSKENLLMKDEVTTSKINAKAVTTEKINDNAVTQLQLGNIITESGNATTQHTKNGITVRLFQESNKGAIRVEVIGDSVINANNSLVGVTTAKSYITGVANTSGYNDLRVNANLYFQGSNIYSGAVVSTNYVQAPYFNATSDIRKKKEINNVENSKEIEEIVETTPIVTFKYLDSEEISLGVIAQQVDKSVSGFNIVTKDEEGYLNIRENKLVYVLWKYIQILNDRVKRLEDSNANNK